MNQIISNPKTRKYIYGVVAAAIPVAVGVGVLTEEQAATVGGAVLGLAAAVLALPNTPKQEKLLPDEAYDTEPADAAE